VPAHDFVVVAPEISRAIQSKAPIVALESAVITHGLPYPQNIQLARDMEAAVRQAGAIPATIAMLDGKIRVGLDDEELTRLAQSRSNLKVSRRDLATAMVTKTSGGTTVAATMFVASMEGISVFATGGIGGVHRESPFDVSADLQALADTSMIVVCAGAKAILDLAATLEYLETMGVPVIGYRTEEFPAFYSLESGLTVSLRLDSTEAIAEYWNTHRSLKMLGAVLVANPIPARHDIPMSTIEPILAKASKEAHERKIRGQALTPFLLARVSELSGGKSVEANEALLLDNARLAAQIANAIAIDEVRKEI
jgi:pseudouridine-5'-phosphate glycosidase